MPIMVPDMMEPNEEMKQLCITIEESLLYVIEYLNS